MYKQNVGEENADAHMKRQIIGREVAVAVTDGRLDFGSWEQIDSKPRTAEPLFSWFSACPVRSFEEEERSLSRETCPFFCLTGANLTGVAIDVNPPIPDCPTPLPALYRPRFQPTSSSGRSLNSPAKRVAGVLREGYWYCPICG